MALYRAAEKLSPLLRKKMKDRETVEERIRLERNEVNIWNDSKKHVQVYKIR